MQILTVNIMTTIKLKYRPSLIEIDDWEINNGYIGDSFIIAATYDGREMTEEEIIEMEEEQPELLYEFLLDRQII